MGAKIPAPGFYFVSRAWSDPARTPRRGPVILGVGVGLATELLSSEMGKDTCKERNNFRYIHAYVYTYTCICACLNKYVHVHAAVDVAVDLDVCEDVYR